MKELTSMLKSNCGNMILCIDKSTSVAHLHDFAMELRSHAITKMNEALEQDKKAMEKQKKQEETKEVKETEEV